MQQKAESKKQNKEKISQDTILKVSKEVAIKFIEMGRITPATFEQHFKTIHTTIQETTGRDE